MALGIFSAQPLFLKKTATALVVCMVLMWLDSKNPSWFAQARSASHAAMQPIYQLSAVPNYTTHWVSGSLQTKEALRRENMRLQSQLIHAQAKLQQQDYILAQNTRLQGVLSVSKSDRFNLQLAQVIGTDSNPTKQIVVINKGKKHGVKIGQTVIDENGIMGQIINVYPNTSRLLLITDEQQSVAVTIKRTGQRAIVTGKGNPTELSLDYIFKTADVRLGDELISSGLGGRIPAGYRIGRIKMIDTQQTGNFVTIDVTPAASFTDNSHVLVLQDKNSSEELNDAEVEQEQNITAKSTVKKP